MKVRKVIRVLTDNGFRQVRQSGSHRQFEGFVNGKRRLVTVAGKESGEVKPDTLAVHQTAIRVASQVVPLGMGRHLRLEDECLGAVASTP